MIFLYRIFSMPIDPCVYYVEVHESQFEGHFTNDERLCARSPSALLIIYLLGIEACLLHNGLCSITKL